jgi:hypothetical protein
LPPGTTASPARPARPARARLVAGLLGLALLATAAACSRLDDEGGAPDVAVSVVVSPDPPAVGEAHVEVGLAGADGRPLPGATVQVEGNMNHAGMTPVFADLEETAPGLHEGALEFTMGGDWFLLVRGELADGRRLERQVDVKGVRTP